MALRHHAFLSYNQAADGTLATAFQHGLEHIAKPLLKLRALDVFRDQTSLTASPALWPGIVAHLQASEWLLLFACPASAASGWCNKELQWWLDNRSTERLLIMLTGGEITWPAQAADFDWGRTNALPRLLTGRLADQPLYVDLRWAREAPDTLSLRNTRWRDAVVNVAAPLHGMRKDELDGADLRQLARNRLLVRGGVAAITLTAALAVWQAIVASQQRDEAVRQRDIAFARQLAAQSALMRAQQPERLPLALLMAAQAVRTLPDSTEAQLTLQAALAPFARPLLSLPHAAQVSGAVFGAGGQTLATAAADGNGMLWKLADATPAATLKGASQIIRVSTDGRRIAGCCKRVAVWDAQGSEQWSAEPSVLRGRPVAIAFSPDGRLLAIGVEGATPALVVVDLDSRTIVLNERAELSGHATALAFLPNGELAVGVRQTIEIYAGTPLQRSRTIDARPRSVHQLAASADGRWLAGSSGNNAFVVDLREGEITTRLQARGDGPGELRQLVFDAGSAHLAAVGDLNSGAIWRTGQWREVVAVRHAELHTIHALSFDSASAEAVSCGNDGYCYGWSLASGQRLHQLAHRHPHAGEDMARRSMLGVAVDGGRALVATAGADGSARLWSLAPAGERSRQRCDTEDVLVRTFMPAGRRWTSEGGRLERVPRPCSVALPADVEMGSVLVADTGALAAVVAPGEVLRVWEVGSGKSVATLAHDDPVDWDAVQARLQARGLSLRPLLTEIDRMKRSGSVHVLALSASGQRAATVRDADERLRFWDTRSGRVTYSEVVGTRRPQVEFVAGDLALRIDDSGVLAGLRLPSGMLAWESRLPALTALALSDDGQRLAAAGVADGRTTLRVLESTTGRTLFETQVEGRFGGLAFDRSGRHLLGLAGDQTPVPSGMPVGIGLTLWHVESGRKLLELPAQDRIVALDFSADGSRFAAVGSGGELRLWDLATGTALRGVIADPGPVAFSASGRWLAVGNRSLRVLDSTSLQPLAQLEAGLEVRRITFRDDDRVLAIGAFAPGESRGLTLERHWRAADLLAEACIRLPRAAAEGQWRQLFPQQAVPMPCPDAAVAAAAPLSAPRP